MRRPEITIGFSVSLSGRFQLQGQQALQGALLWQSYVNVQGGIAVREGEKGPVRLIWFDDHGQIDLARENVLRLLCEQRIDILLGPYSSGLTMAVAEIVEEYRKVLWNHGGSSDEIFRRSWRCLVGIASPASEYLRALPQWLAKQYPALSRICVFYSSRGTFGCQVARGILESTFPGARQSVELVPINVPLENHETIVRLLLAVCPDIVVLAGEFSRRSRHHANTPSLAQQRTCGGRRCCRPECFFCSSPPANRVVGPSQWERGTTFPNIIGPTSDWFVDSFQKQCGEPPDYVAAGCFASGLLLAECIRRAACLDDEELRRAASELDCNTFYGRFRIDSQSGIQTGHRVLLIRWQGGRKVMLPSLS